jgi:hypothetical protein
VNDSFYPGSRPSVELSTSATQNRHDLRQSNMGALGQHRPAPEMWNNGTGQHRAGMA